MKLTNNSEIEVIELNQDKRRSNEITFDISTLTESNFKRYLMHLDEISGSPLEFLLLSTLGAISGSAGKMYYFKASESLQIFPNLWCCIVGSSTITRKSSALNISTIDLMRIEELNSKEHTQALTKYNEEKKENKELEKPKRDYLVFPSDSTLEAFATILEYSNRGLIVHQELASFLGQLNRSYAGDSKATLTALYDIPQIYEISRQTRENIVLKRPFFTILSASTFSWLKKFTQQDDLSSGFLSRFIFAYRRTSSKQYKALVDLNNPNFRSKYFINAREIFDNICSRCEPIEIRFEDESAKNLHRQKDIEFYNDRILTATDENLQASFSRLNVASIKLSILLALFNGREQISINDVKDAFTLVNYFSLSAELIFTELKQKTQFEEKEKKVLELIQKHQNIKHSKLLQNSNLNKKEFLEVIETLKDKEVISEYFDKTEGSKKQTKFYKVIE